MLPSKIFQAQTQLAQFRNKPFLSIEDLNSGIHEDSLRIPDWDYTYTLTLQNNESTVQTVNVFGAAQNLIANPTYLPSWQPQVSGIALNLAEIFFIDSQTGWAVGDTGTILNTTDGGTTWNQTQPTDGLFNSPSEGFTFTTQILKEGIYTIQVRAKNSEGIYTKQDQYANDTLTIVTTPPKITQDKIKNLIEVGRSKIYSQINKIMLETLTI